MSVILNAPSVFRWTASASPERHLQAATWLGGEVRGAGPENAGEVLSGMLIELMRQTGMPNGLRAIGFSEADVDELVAGTLPQHRVTKLAPRPAAPEDLKELFLGALSYWE
jgi:hydroxyacid-oxoacid transhydrogenase